LIKALVVNSPSVAVDRLDQLKNSVGDADHLVGEYDKCLQSVQAWANDAENQLKSDVDHQKKALDDTVNKLGLLATELDKKRSEEEAPKAPVFDKVVFPIAILCLILLIPVLVLLLKRFEPNVQGKMIDNRFVIEILSIALLVVAIIILGTADKLKTEALGTLLGTVAGYVLSRNVAERVGMAASAAAKKTIEEVTRSTKGDTGSESV
jgi:hypothetical protein